MNIARLTASILVVLWALVGPSLDASAFAAVPLPNAPPEPARLITRATGDPVVDHDDQVALLPGQPHSSPGVWKCWTTPGTVPCNHNLYAVDALSETDAWAAGEAGTIIHWDGQDWLPMPTPTLASLHAIDMLSPMEGWATGSGVILHWDGVVWSAVDNPTGAELTSLSMVSPTDGWGVGPDSPIMHWDGSIWAVQANTGSDDLYNVNMASAVDGWAVGGFINPYGNYDNAVVWHWNGQSWTGADVPPPSGGASSEYLSGVQIISEDDAWAVGGGYGYYTGNFATILHWNGQEWTRVPAPTSAHLHALSMVSPSDGWAVGSGYDYMTGQHLAPVLRWDGVAWTEVTNPVNGPLGAIAAVSPVWVFALTGNSLLAWNGESWAEQIHPGAGAGITLQSVDLVSPDDAWAVGSNPGTILNWDGLIWQEIDNPLTHPLTETLNAIDMVSTDDGWIAGGAEDYSIILRWNGQRWKLFPDTPGGRLRSISMAAPDDGWAVGDTNMLRWDGVCWSEAPAARCSLNAVAMVSATDGWAVGAHGCILHWDGSSWDQMVSPTWFDLSSVAMLSAQDGWAVGGSAFLHWDGRGWSNMNAAPIGSAQSVTALSPWSVWSVGNGIQQWDGSAWSRAANPTSRHLNGVALKSSAGGWAVGEGVILRYTGPLPAARVYLPMIVHEQEDFHGNSR